ncbi:MAG TPA: hypothetical protein VEG33_21090, partial [Streptosporangiaceae bacterium]|nr:hypothetical protein [Streptosporangiaceae bacterium]
HGWQDGCGFVEGVEPVADNERSASGAVPALVEAFTSQLRAVTEGLEQLAGLGQRVPLPGALSAAQLTSIADSIAAQRRTIEALKAQLSSFDEQLAALEQMLGPLAQWSATWAELEKRLLNLGRGPEGQGRVSGSSPDRSLSGGPPGVPQPTAGSS